jgi:hypothetical protein
MREGRHKLLELEHAGADLSEILRAVPTFLELSELTTIEKQGLAQRTISKSGKSSFVMHEADKMTHMSSPNTDEL